MYLTKSDNTFRGTAYHNIGGPGGLLSLLAQFEHRSMSGQWFEGGVPFRGGPPIPKRYIVFSYRTAIAVYRPDNNTIYLNEWDYSHTTSCQQSMTAAWLNHPHTGPVVVCHDEGDLMFTSRKDD